MRKRNSAEAVAITLMYRSIVAGPQSRNHIFLHKPLIHRVDTRNWMHRCEFTQNRCHLKSCVEGGDKCHRAAFVSAHRRHSIAIGSSSVTFLSLCFDHRLLHLFPPTSPFSFCYVLCSVIYTSTMHISVFLGSPIRAIGPVTPQRTHASLSSPPQKYIGYVVFSYSAHLHRRNLSARHC